jgi:hypothetical protein
MALNTQPCGYVKTVTTLDCSVVHGLKQKPRRSSQTPQKFSCAALTRAQRCRAKCMPVTIWVNAGVIAL